MPDLKKKWEYQSKILDTKNPFFLCTDIA